MNELIRPAGTFTPPDTHIDTYIDDLVADLSHERDRVVVMLEQETGNHARHALRERIDMLHRQIRDLRRR